MALFIRVDVDQAVVNKAPGLAKKLVDVCPVKIFAAGKEPESVAVVEDNVDECTLVRALHQGVAHGRARDQALRRVSSKPAIQAVFRACRRPRV